MRYAPTKQTIQPSKILLMMETIPAVAARLGISEIGVWKLIRTHKIPLKIDKFGRTTVDPDRIRGKLSRNGEK